MITKAAEKLRVTLVHGSPFYMKTGLNQKNKSLKEFVLKLWGIF